MSRRTCFGPGGFHRVDQASSVDDHNIQKPILLKGAARDLQSFSVERWPQESCVRFVVIKIPGDTGAEDVFIYEWFGHTTQLDAIKTFVKAMVPEVFKKSVKLMYYARDEELPDNIPLNKLLEDARADAKKTNQTAGTEDIILRYPNTIFMRAVPA